MDTYIERAGKRISARRRILNVVRSLGCFPRIRSRQDFGQHASNASNLWPDRLPTPVAEVAKTLDSMPAMHPICGQIGYQPLVAEVAKTLDSVPVLRPICV